MAVDVTQPIVVTMTLEEYQTAKEILATRADLWVELTDRASAGLPTDEIKTQIQIQDEYLAMLMQDALS